MLDLTPGFTAIPNDFLDQTAPTLTAAELRVALYIYRHTIGYQKLSDAISYSQFTDGITSHDGRKLDYGAGVSRRSLPVALAGLERRGVISRSSGTCGGAVRYSIVQPGVHPKAKATGKSPQSKAGTGSGPKQPVAAPLATPRPGQNSQVPTPAPQAEPEVSPQELQTEVGQISPAPVPQLGQKLQETASQLGQILPPTIQTDSKIKPDRAAAVNFITQEIAGISTNQAEKLVSIAMSNQRDISYIERLVGYVASVAGNPAAMLTTLIKTNQDRTTGSGQVASHHINRRKSEIPGYDWTLKKPTSRQPIDFSKPFYQHLIAQQNNLSVSASHLEDIE